MKVSEKTLELNVGAEILARLREGCGLKKAYLRGLTQREEKREGVDFVAQLGSGARIFAFQFKAPKGSVEVVPYRYTLSRRQHEVLYALAKSWPDGVFYVLPFYVTHAKLRTNLPDLSQDTWLLPVASMTPSDLFDGRRTKTIRCRPRVAFVNPEYPLRHLHNLQMQLASGVPAQEFGTWYTRYLSQELLDEGGRRSPWLVRGLRFCVAEG
jgi:hypothetical protein